MLKFRFAQEHTQLDLFDDFHNEDREDIIREYIENIHKNKSKPILDTIHLSKILGFSESLLFSISSAPSKFYREYKVPKKNGGVRIINEPLPTLKEIQRIIVSDILYNVEVHKSAKAYRKNHTLRGNAIIHRRRPYLLKVDIKNFFASIDMHAVYSLFYNLGYTSQIARLLTGLCTLHNGLPQGAPSSPLLSNLVMRDFDEAMFAHCVEQNFFYTRYADDMTFSGTTKSLKDLFPVIRKELKKNRLVINERKTTFSGKGGRKYVTGIIVNEKLNIPRIERKKLRQEMYYIKKYGINGHIRKTEITQSLYIERIIGRLNFAFFVTKEKSFLDEMKYLMELRKII